jgi:spore coat polysaccharide biosynthesis predicted glycosyltransferase SpsG
MLCITAIADAFPAAGLGHLARSSAVVAALRSRGLEVSCLAHGASQPITFDRVRWEPWDGVSEPLSAGSTLLDTYTLDWKPNGSRLITFFDPGTKLQEAAALTIAPAVDAAAGHGDWLCGLQYTCLRPGYWGAPAALLREEVRRVVVTTGGGDPGQASLRLVSAAQAAMPAAQIRRVRGPFAHPLGMVGVTELDAPTDLRGELSRADLVLCLGGQTAAEAASLGVPTVAVAAVDNQRATVARLARLGAVAAGEFDDGLVETLQRLARSPSCRELQADAGRRAVDGFGALRVAGEIERLLALSG